jgi:peptide deformylase
MSEVAEREAKILGVVQYPDDGLSERSQVVTRVVSTDPELREFVNDLEATVVGYGAIGISAIQVGMPLRILIARGTPDLVVETNDPAQPATPHGKSITNFVIINPIVEEISLIDRTYVTEGCLSFPGLAVRVHRSPYIKIKYLDRNGDIRSLHAKDLLARCIQHEIDHLDGKLFIDKLHPLEYTNAMRKLKNFRRKLK